jgi:hypothetical protein
MNANTPLSVPEIKKQVENETLVSLSKHLITSYIKSNLDVSFRKIK